MYGVGTAVERGEGRTADIIDKARQGRAEYAPRVRSASARSVRSDDFASVLANTQLR